MTYRSITVVALTLSLVAQAAEAQTCVRDDEGLFPNGRVPVRFVHGASAAGSAQFAVFQAPLAVNTDGAPVSYHPDDPTGARLAINNFANGISVTRTDGRPLSYQQKLDVFRQWRSSGNWTAPEGYRVFWKNVIAADGNAPCTFQSGEHKGYFGSLTALKNGLPAAQQGECSAANQIDQRFIPAIVLRGGRANPLTAYGAAVGDLVLAINPRSGTTVAAVIGDTGDAERIGEGSVALNMALLGRTAQPTTYNEAKRLDTGAQAMIVAVLPRTAHYQLATPYSASNITTRVQSWASEHGYGSLSDFAKTVQACIR